MVDISRRHVPLAGHEISNLTPTEFEIFVYLARNAWLVLTLHQILEHVWGPEWVTDAATLRTHASNLRQMIEPSSGARRYIFTQPGVGFRLASSQLDATTDAAVLPCGRQERETTSHDEV